MAKGNWRDSLDRKLLNVLKRDGIEQFLSVAVASLSVDPGGDGKFKAQFVGEVCEVVFWGLTKEYLRATQRKAEVFHSVVLKDLRNPKSDFRTECDFVLVSPSFILTTECKSYAGGIEVCDNCTLVHKGQRTDVYKQSKLHYDKLYLYAQQLALPDKGVAVLPVAANVFCFSDSAIRDLRSKRAQDLLKVTTSSSLLGYYDDLFRNLHTPLFDYERACKIFKVCAASKMLHAQHQEYLGY